MKESARIAERLGAEGVDQLLAVLPIYYRFMQINAEIFDNTRLLAEGIHPAPKLTTYLERCVANPSARSIYQQMLDDV